MKLERRLGFLESKLGATEDFWLRQARRFARAEDYLAWIESPASRPIRDGFMRRMGSSNRTMENHIKEYALESNLFSWNLFLRLNQTCASKCDELTERMRNCAARLQVIVRQLRLTAPKLQKDSFRAWPLLEEACAVAVVCLGAETTETVEIPKRDDTEELDKIAKDIVRGMLRGCARPPARSHHLGGYTAAAGSGAAANIEPNGQEDRAVTPGARVSLPSIPIAALRELPLVGGEWLDKFFVRLAEFGTRVKSEASTLTSGSSDKTHKHHFGAGVSLWARIDAELANLPGETRLIARREHVRLRDYQAWANRQAACDLRSGEGSAGSSPLVPRSASFFASLVTDPVPDGESVQVSGIPARDWAQELADLASAVDELDTLVTWCEKKHFHSRKILFPDIAERIDRLLRAGSTLVLFCNEGVALGLLPSCCKIVVNERGADLRLFVKAQLEDLLKNTDETTAATMSILRRNSEGFSEENHRQARWDAK